MNLVKNYQSSKDHRGPSVHIRVQLNLHETYLLFRYLSHHLTWYCFSISEDLHRFARNLQYLSTKLFRNNNKNNFELMCCTFPANLCKSSEILKQYDVK